MKLYKIVIRDNTPELVPISSSGTFQTPDGKLYWIIPVSVESEPTQTTIIEPTIIEPTIIEPTMSEVEDKVIALLKKGVRPTAEIARRASLTSYTVTQIIRAAGLKTPSETLRDKIEEMLRNAGAIGVSTYEIGKLTSSMHQIGPIMAGMLRRGEVKRLNNGNYVTLKEGKP